MKRVLMIICGLSFFLSSPFFSEGQTLKFRLSGNSTRFTGEPQGTEINHPLIDTMVFYKGIFPEFIHDRNFGFEGEIMTALSSKVWIGLEIGTDRLTGKNDNPGLFNFQYTDSLQLNFTDTLGYINKTITIYPLKYQTSLINFIVNFRIYPLPDGRFQPFIKASAGLSLISTELALKDSREWIDTLTYLYGPKLIFSSPVLYSNGRGDSKNGIVAAFNIGGGIGCEFKVTDKLGLYADWTYRMVKSGILDGKPNFDYNKDIRDLVYFNTWSTINKFTFGIVYTLSDSFSLFGGGGSVSRKGETGKGKPNLPFYRLKPR
jgi:hypothetical protein